MAGSKITGLKETQAKFNALPARLKIEIKAEIQNSANEWVGLAKRDAAQNGDTGTLIREISSLQVGELTWEVVSGANYAGYVEFGTRSRVEIPTGLEAVASEVQAQKTSTSVSAKEAIFAWCKRKGIDEKLWYPIFISLMTKGMHAHPYFFKQRAIIEPQLRQRIDQILKSID